MQAANNSVRQEKIVLIGSQGTGKTSLVMRYCKDQFTQNQASTVGAAFNSKVLTIGSQKLQLDIWDTAGSEKYRSLAPMYYRDARAAIVVVDVTNPDSLPEADDWLLRIREGGRSDCVFVLAANKCDLHDKEKVTIDKISEFAFNHQLNYYRNTSALTGEGVQELFEALGLELLKLPPLSIANDEVDQLINPAAPTGQSSGSSGCC